MSENAQKGVLKRPIKRLKASEGYYTFERLNAQKSAVFYGEI